MEKPAFVPSFAPLFKNVEDAIARWHASPTFFGLAIRAVEEAVEGP
jgi:hypothetical protein